MRYMIGQPIAVHPRRCGALAALLFGMTIASVAMTENSRTALAQASSDNLEEIIVTASKRSENIEKAPEAITAISGAQLEAQGAVSFADYAREVPGMAFTDLGNGREQPSIRGVNANAGASTVSFFIDETAIPETGGQVPLNNGSNPQLVDVDRIEVLKGPQGTLYGASSMGGAIKYIPKTPNLDTYSGSVSAEATGIEDGGLGIAGTAVVNLPIKTDIAGIRVALWDGVSPGFIDRKYGYIASAYNLSAPIGFDRNIAQDRTLGARIIALINPVNGLSIQALYYRQSVKFNGLQNITAGVTNPNENLVQELLYNTSEPGYNQDELYNLKTILTVNNMSVLSTTSYYKAMSLTTEEGAEPVANLFGSLPYPSRIPEYDGRKAFTQELRASTIDPVYGFEGLAGVYFNRTTRRTRDPYVAPGYDAAVAPDGPSDPNYTPNDVLYNGVSSARQREEAVFGELSYHVLDAVKATFGFRHYWITNSNADVAVGILQDPSNPGVLEGYGFASQAEGNVFKGNISYQYDEQTLMYAQYTEGFRAGFGQPILPVYCGQGAVAPVVKPDSLDNYEVGMKTALFDRRLFVDLSVFDIEWNQIQQAERLACGFDKYTNAGKAENRGAEFDIHGRVNEIVSAGLSGSYTHAALQNSDVLLGALKGDQIEGVPTWQIAVYLSANKSLNENTSLFSRADFTYTGQSYTDYSRLADGDRDPYSRKSALSLLNVRFGVDVGDWEFAASADNLLNDVETQAREISLIADIDGRPRLVVNRPRSFSLGAKFFF